MKAVHRVSLMFLYAVLLCGACPTARADWWPPSKWFASDPKDTTLSEVCKCAEAALVPLEKDQYEEFAANHLVPATDANHGNASVVNPHQVRKIFKHQRELVADLHRVSPKTLMLSPDMNIATIVSVQEGLYLNFVKQDGRWYIHDKMQDMHDHPPAPKREELPVEQTVQQPGGGVKPEPKVASDTNVVFKTASSVRAK